ncbi:hypothetical protein PFISCL1PPCAC_25186 [Pristionchus fissidentatus]|uniref:GDP-fucose protein O-fucosyltransferase 1 n=1 Tax=Pristionchus fissidentatus TaxID=1538716 RepID=A0AAV5WP23_9BILA|nr:hypothetical protein PFISCL1PPCAC_25186 [Pristionchus fissidentatus]
MLPAALLLLLTAAAAVASAAEVDPNGYVIYCPCMGRFGNQMEQHLGAFHFANVLGRTIVLPPMVGHEPGSTIAKMTAFEDVFQLAPIKKHFKSITLAEFQRDIAPKIWPKEQRKAFCWTPRTSSTAGDDETPSCRAKDGNPFGPFWDHIGVDEFADSVFYGRPTGGFNVGSAKEKEKWMTNYPASSFPVLAFTGAPSNFPSQQKHWHYQKHFRYSTRITSKAKSFIEDRLTRPFVGIHLRNDIDWNRVCEHVDPSRNLFASAQCLGEPPQDVMLSKEMCLPSRSTVLDQIVEVVGRSGAKSVFVSADKDHMIDEINGALSAYDVKAYRLDDNDPLVSLAILELADEFIGNCVSTFSSVVSRSRTFKWAKPKPSHFWGYKIPDTRPKIEL